MKKKADLKRPIDKHICSCDDTLPLVTMMLMTTATDLFSITAAMCIIIFDVDDLNDCRGGDGSDCGTDDEDDNCCDDNCPYSPRSHIGKVSISA